MKKLLLIILSPLLLFSCRAVKTVILPSGDQVPVIVYQTRADYSHNVPITLDETGKQVLAYPAPSDLLYGGELRIPTNLKKGYLLDQKGVQPNTAFTSYNYEEYSKLSTAPPPEELLNRVIDREPFTEMYNCGKHGEFTDLIKELNQLITDDFKGCKKLIR